MIRRKKIPLKILLIGPGGAGKTTVGALLAEHLGLPFIDLDRQLAREVGDISEYINRNGYDAYARANIEAYCAARVGRRGATVLALSSGFMTYASHVHPDYPSIRRAIERHPHTFVLLPSSDRDACVAETVRRQMTRPFARTLQKEEEVIRTRFDIYMALSATKIETMRRTEDVVDDIAWLLRRGDAQLNRSL
jgi:shikimate kinase